MRQANGASSTLYAVSFSDVNTGTVVGRYGAILRTTDGGSAWIWVAPSVGGITLRGVSFSDANTGTVVGNGGTILRTTDGGSTWESQWSGTTYTLYAASFTGTNTGTVVGNFSTILGTTSGRGP